MAERAHPKDFRKPGSLYFRLRRGWMPWLSRVKQSPFYDEFMYRYDWANGLINDLEVLEIPCGMGWGTSLMSNAQRILGVDIAEDAIAEAKKMYPNAGDFSVGTMESLEFDDCSLDAVVCLEGIEHVPIQVADRFLAESHRVLRDGGLFLVSSPHAKNGGHSGNEFHIHEYQPDEIKAKLDSYFTVEHMHAREVGHMVVTYFKCVKAK